MQADIDLARFWRLAYTGVFVTMLAGVVAIATTGGPGLIFCIVSGAVFALIACDLWINFRAPRSDRSAFPGELAAPKVVTL